MTPKQLLTALFTLVFVAGFIVNSYQTYFAVALCVILAMIVFVGGSDSGGGAAETKTKERKDSEVNNL